MGGIMQKCFQNLFKDPVNHSDLRYFGTYKNGNWDTGILRSMLNEWKVIDGIPYFNSDNEGDQFSLDDIDSWVEGGRFKRRWQNKGNKYMSNNVYSWLCKQVATLNLPIMEISCGPGLGLLPDIITMNPNVNCLATDACSSVVLEWNKFISDKDATENISFASFDTTNMPIHSNSIDVITSYIGLSSIRCPGEDGMKGVNETYRVLKPGGYLFTIENTWKDRKAIHEVFDLWGRDCWYRDNELSWHDKFQKANFKIIDEKLQETRVLTPQDNELGEIAYRFGIEIGMEYRAYILRKV
jgi:SAM-dependent methyltransferase